MDSIAWTEQSGFKACCKELGTALAEIDKATQDPACPGHILGYWLDYARQCLRSIKTYNVAPRSTDAPIEGREVTPT